MGYGIWDTVDRAKKTAIWNPQQNEIHYEFIMNFIIHGNAPSIMGYD